MNWDAIGAIAELLGAIGVIASLVYLATQIRQSRDQMVQNTRALRIASHRHLREEAAIPGKRSRTRRVGLLWLLVLVTGCRSLDRTEFWPPSPEVRGLPRVELVFDPALTNESAQRSDSELAARPRLETERELHGDAEQLLRAHLEQVFSGGERPQTLTVRFRVRSEPLGAWELPLMASLFTLSAINLLGIPAWRTTQSVDLLVVAGPDETPRFRVSGMGSAYVAYWWGYSGDTGDRVAMLRATQDALRKLDLKLAREAVDEEPAD